MSCNRFFQRWLSMAGMLAVLAPASAVLGPASAQAVPLYFEGPGAWGFDPADVLGFPVDALDPDVAWRTAGDAAFSPDLTVETSLDAVVSGDPDDPSFADPLVARIDYDVTNTSGDALLGALLVFTFGRVDAVAPETVDPYPSIEPAEFGLDSDGILLLSYGPYVFGAVALPDLLDGESHSFSVLHVVADDLDGDLIPTPGLAMTEGLLGGPQVPEPAAALMCVLGLGGLVLLGRRKA